MAYRDRETTPYKSLPSQEEMYTPTQPQVVIVDDEPVLVELVVATLADASIEAVACSSGRSALECIRSKLPSVVILDVQMPEVDGIQLFQELRADPVMQRKPVIFLTANGHILSRRLPDYRSRGAILVSKPFRLRVLLQAVRTALEQGVAG